MMMKRLTREEVDAVCSILDERLAGGDEDLASALGMNKEEGERVYWAAERANDKLKTRLNPKKKGGSKEK